MRRPPALLALAVVLLSGGALARADGALCEAGGPRITAARTALAAAPASLPARFELADALIEGRCYHDAVHALEGGKAIHPRSAELSAKLRTTRSLVSEQDYFEGKEQAEIAARLSRNLLRCTRLGDLDSCDQALKVKPDDAQLLLAKGEALLKASRPGEADAVYRRAREIVPNDTRIATQLAATHAQRQPLLESCRRDHDDAALQACRSALSKGADDEREILARMAALRQPRPPAPAAASSLAPVRALTASADGPVAQASPTARRYSNAAEPGRSH